MKIQLIHGKFEAQEALELVSKLIHTKIKFHESRITNFCKMIYMLRVNTLHHKKFSI
jgi:hypothetical protein